MADQKISQLTEVVSPAVGDMMPVVNAGSTKKVTIQNAVKAYMDAREGWTLLATQVIAGAGQYDFINLAGYTDLRVFVRAVVLSVSGEARLRVSIDNGSTFLSTSGDYLGISGAGVETSFDALAFYAGNATAARTGEVFIEGFGMGNQKVTRANIFSTDSVHLRVVPNTTAFNAVRVFSTAGVMNTGDIFVFGRR